VAAWDEGHVLPLEQAIAYALDECDLVPSGIRLNPAPSTGSAGAAF